MNYDRILRIRPTELPRIEREGVCFERRYVYETNRIRFQTRLIAEGIDASSEVSLLPLRSRSLLQGLRSAGFTRIELHDDFTDAPFDIAASFALVAVARKENV
ncbi:MAG: hypothetical protein MZU97_05380 [Bacillus subtilis]|nr:hypothetical protein [Bacillus subtilis]